MKKIFQKIERFTRKILEGIRYLIVLLFEDEEQAEQKVESLEETPLPPFPQVVVQPDSTVAPDVQAEAKAVELNLGSSVAPEYRKSKHVLSYQERSLYRALRRANDNEYLIFVKVRMGDFVYLANEPEDRKIHNSRIFCKHVDFLFCDKFTIEPLLVVELDDSSHKLPDHLERDIFKDETFTAINLPFMRIEIQKEYDWRLLQREIKEKIGKRPVVPNWK